MPTSEITTIAAYNGSDLKLFIKGINLYRFPEILKNTKTLVTFNGARFDLPFLRKRFGLDLNNPHIDLLKVTRSYGYKGGLKACEKKMGIHRGAMSETGGKEATQLWQRYSMHGEKEALQKLLVYNSMDVLNLETIMIRMYNESMCTWPLFRKYPHTEQPDPYKVAKAFFDN